MKSTTILLTILLVFLLGIRLFFDSQDRQMYKVGEVVKITHSFLKEPKKNSHGQYFFTSNILISIPLYPRYSYGDTVEIKGEISEIENNNNKTLVIKNPRITILPKKNPLLIITSFIRKRVEGVVLSTLPPRESGLLLGIVLGVRDRIDAAFYEQLRDAGVLHIIAASGQNVSILASIMLASFEKFVKRKKAILFTGFFIFIYAALVGFDPPIVRASIMAIISFGALAFGRRNTALFTLFLTGWGMIFYQPTSLTDISFQLSFLSTFGIITVKPIIEKALKLKYVSLFKEDLTTTLAAQIATFPVMIASFGAYSLLTLPINLLILWTIPFLMTIGVIIMFVAVIIPILAKPFVLISYPLLAYFAFVIDVSARFMRVLEVQAVPTSFICGYYLILIATVLRFKSIERRTI